MQACSLPNITYSEWAEIFESILDARITYGELHPRMAQAGGAIAAQ